MLACQFICEPDLALRLFTYFYPFMMANLKDDAILVASTGNLDSNEDYSFSSSVDPFTLVTFLLWEWFSGAFSKDW